MAADANFLPPEIDLFRMDSLHLLRKLTMALRAVPGGVLVGEALRKPMARRRRHVRVDDFDGDLSMTLDLGEHMQSQTFWHGYYSRDIIFLLRRLLGPGKCLVDGGANVGEISLVAAKLVGPSGRVIAFEPVASFADQAEANVRANHLAWVEIHRTGLSAATGQASIYTVSEAFHDGTHHDGLGSLFAPENGAAPVGVVPTVSLDEFVAQGSYPRIDVLKLDIEGGELAALQGAVATLDQQHPAVIVEVNDQTCRRAGYVMRDILDFLSGLDYEFYRIGRRGSAAAITADGLADFQNVLCVQRGTWPPEDRSPR